MTGEFRYVSAVTIAVLTAQGVVFAVWGFLAFRFLFALRRDAVAASGNVIPGLGATLTSFHGGLTAPKYRRQRRVFLLVTVLLFVLIGTNALTAMRTG